ncbi:hypothetical protein [Aquiflexum sp.]|uniref:hypothetical protein n=1 Tax=Aquiflexum sp. TaxID=1872584 RepID=UPI0035937057
MGKTFFRIPNFIYKNEKFIGHARPDDQSDGPTALAISIDYDYSLLKQGAIISVMPTAFFGYRILS